MKAVMAPGDVLPLSQLAEKFHCGFQESLGTLREKKYKVGGKEFSGIEDVYGINPNT